VDRLKINNKMAHRDTFSEFNPAVEDFDCYVERLSMYFEANNIDADKQKSVFLSVIGPQALLLVAFIVCT
jgi:hypothetical protein